MSKLKPCLTGTILLPAQPAVADGRMVLISTVNIKYKKFHRQKKAEIIKFPFYVEAKGSIFLFSDDVDVITTHGLMRCQIQLWMWQRTMSNIEKKHWKNKNKNYILGKFFGI